MEREKQLKDYFPQPEGEQTLVQAKVPRDLANQTREILDKMELTWADFVAASMRKLVDEAAPKKGKHNGTGGNG